MSGSTAGNGADLNQPRTDQGVITIGVVADTHIPDRTSRLHPSLVPALRELGVQRILHAGDVSMRYGLDELARLAPVTAVRGNRDLLLRGLPMLVQMEVNGVRIALTHGHGGWITYLRDKVRYLLRGYQLERHLAALQKANPQAQVIIFGHTHHPAVIHRGEQLLFNPGSASFGSRPASPPSFGLLRIGPDAQVSTELFQLRGWRLKWRRWIAI